MAHLIPINHHLSVIEKIVRDSLSQGEMFEGNCFYYHNTFITDESFFPKHLNIMQVSKTGNNIVEIGFNAGHSALLMLAANKNAHIHAFDICYHPYTKPCIEYLNSQYNNRITLHEGNSHITLKDFVDTNPSYKFDVLHVDGNHEYCHTNIDFFLSKRMSRPGAYCIYDDTGIQYIDFLWKGYIRDGHITESIMRDSGIHRHSIGTFT